jgi:diguanylate cyclase (GGDEF)-like protein/putative nucleotidyltransferase with HDIG domain
MPIRGASSRLVAALAEIAAATSVEECAATVQRRAAGLFPGLHPQLKLGTGPDGPQDAVFALSARGRTIGHLQTSRPVPARRRRQRAALQTLAEHAALALDNLFTIAEHDARARRDPLTGLLNHREFHEALASHLEHAQAARPPLDLSIVIFDLDRFKSVNDHGGHAAGDRTLRAAAGAVAAACRTTDAAFRIGGDEFAVVLPRADREAAARIARRAADAIERVAHRPGVSFGVATHPHDGTTRDALLTAADGAMYTNKGRTGSAGHDADAAPTRSRLAVAARLATKLAPLDEPDAIAATAVDELHEAFGFFLAVIQRLDADDVLRIVAAAGPLAAHDDFLAHEQPIQEGVNGRVARTGRPAVIADTTTDPDYLRRDPRSDPGSELSLPILVDGRIWGVLNLEQLATHAFGDDDLLLADAVAAQVGAALHRAALTQELETSFATTLGVLADVLETKDAYTADHADEVAELALRTGRDLGLTDAELRPLRYCALLHDIGKIGVRSDLLSKPGRLTPAEFEEIKEHSAIGAALLQRIPLLTEIAPLVRAVHERYDGAGYPDGLHGHHIPLPARIVAVCDALHAMTSDRPYRQARPVSVALAELRRCAGTQFDPEIVAAVAQAATATRSGGGSPASAAAAARRARRSSRISSSAGTSATRTPTSDHV